MRFRVCVFSVALVFVSTVLYSQSKPAPEFRPQIPKVWDDDLVASMALPVAPPAPPVTHFSASYYYSIPSVTIYKSYPLVVQDKPFAEHLAWLKQQEPEVAFDPARLKTKADWEKAGELVFSFALGGYGAVSQQVMDAASQPVAKQEPDLRTFLASARVFIREKGKLEMNRAGGPLVSVQACTFCHSQFSSDGKRLDGMQPNRPGIYPSPGTFGNNPDDRRRNMLLWYGTPWLKPDPNVDSELTAAEIRKWNTAPAVDDREGTSFKYPTKIPVLIGLKDRKYFDHTGLHQHRSIGDLMRYAVLASGMELFTKYGDFIPGDLNNNKDLPNPATRWRFSDEQLYALALYLYSLDYPANPNKPDALSAMGEKVFKRESCTGCHTPPLYTNNMLIPADGFVVPADHKVKYDIYETRIGVDPYLATRTRRGTGYYKVPSLRGVWLRSVLEHNGSVASLEDWFDAKRIEDSYVPTGFRGPNPTRAVKGHLFGLRLSSEDKKALIAFLRTL